MVAEVIFIASVVVLVYTYIGLSRSGARAQSFVWPQCPDGKCHATGIGHHCRS